MKLVLAVRACEFASGNAVPIVVEYLCRNHIVTVSVLLYGVKIFFALWAFNFETPRKNPDWVCCVVHMSFALMANISFQPTAYGVG